MAKYLNLNDSEGNEHIGYVLMRTNREETLKAIMEALGEHFDSNDIELHDCTDVFEHRFHRSVDIVCRVEDYETLITFSDGWLY